MIRKKPAIPIAVVNPPMTAKITLQLPGCSKSKNIKPPKTTKMLTSGIIALIPSAAPRFEESVESVNQALNAASLAVEPKNVITQSIIIVRLTPTVAAETVIPKVLLIISSRRKIKLKMERCFQRLIFMRFIAELYNLTIQDLALKIWDIKQ